MKRFLAGMIGIGIVGFLVAWSNLVGASSYQRPLNPSLVTELTANSEPNMNFFMCTPGTYLGGDATKLKPVSGCIYHSSFGDWDFHSATRFIYIGPRGGFPMVSSVSRFLPPVANSTAVLGLQQNDYGDYGVAKYTISDSDMTLQNYWSMFGEPNWQYNLQPIQSKRLTYPNSKAVLSSVYETVGFSPNGQWMAIKVRGAQGGGIALVDMATFTPKVISWDSAFSMNVTTSGDLVKADTVAVSNDGRYVAATGTVSDKPQLRIYDTTTCADQIVNYGKDIKNCVYGDVWNGTYPSGISATGSVKAPFPDAEYPRGVKFTADGHVTFQSIHNRTSSTIFQVAQYSVANVMSEDSVYIPKKLLAMGDSYISGEGAYSYITGTDTSNNKCHQSTLSYPYLLGAKYFSDGGYHSVACSGATTMDILNDTGEYLGQVKNKVKWYLRDQITPIKNYSPGYANQLRFITQDKPDVVLLSIGGNDVHFADIVTLCVLSGPTNPCFSTRSERQELLQYIYSRHDDLVMTYRKILEDSPERRLYVVGYPQVMSTTGSCDINVHFDDSERQFGTLLIDRINATIKNAAESAGAQYVDISHSLDGHRLCEGTADGMNGLTTGNDKLILGNESYHPTALGHALIAATIDSKTKSLTTAMPEPSYADALTITQNEAFLSNLPPGLSIIRRLIFSNIVSEAYAAVTSQLQVKLDASLANIPPDQYYEMVLFSDEVKVGEGKVSSDGTIHTTITIPRIVYGAHTLHIFTTDKDGTPLDIVQVVYVGVNNSDLDGDGIANDADPEPFVNDTGTVVGEIPVEVPPTDSTDTGGTTGSGETGQGNDTTTGKDSSSSTDQSSTPGSSSASSDGSTTTGTTDIVAPPKSQESVTNTVEQPTGVPIVPSATIPTPTAILSVQTPITTEKIELPTALAVITGNESAVSQGSGAVLDATTVVAKQSTPKAIAKTPASKSHKFNTRQFLAAILSIGIIMIISISTSVVIIHKGRKHSGKID